MISRSIGVKPIDGVGATPLDMKNTIGALITAKQAGAPRLGIFYPHAVPLASGTDSLAYTVNQCQAVVSPGPGYGVHLLTVTEPTLVPTTPGSDAGSRIDLLTIRQQDPDVGEEANEPLLEVVSGQTSVTDPLPPTDKLPQGALVLAEITVPPGMNATNLPGVAIKVNVPYTSFKGSPVPVRNQAEADVLSAYPLGTQALRLDKGGFIHTLTNVGMTGTDGAAVAPGVGGWDVTGVIFKRLVSSNPLLFEVELNARYQRTDRSFTLTGEPLNLLPGAVPVGYRPVKAPNGDVMRGTGSTFVWFPTGLAYKKPDMQLWAPDSGNIWARSTGGGIEIPQWAFINVAMKWLTP